MYLRSHCAHVIKAVAGPSTSRPYSAAAAATVRSVSTSRPSRSTSSELSTVNTAPAATDIPPSTSTQPSPPFERAAKIPQYPHPPTSQKVFKPLRAAVIRKSAVDIAKEWTKLRESHRLKDIPLSDLHNLASALGFMVPSLRPKDGYKLDNPIVQATTSISQYLASRGILLPLANHFQWALVSGESNEVRDLFNRTDFPPERHFRDWDTICATVLVAYSTTRNYGGAFRLLRSGKCSIPRPGFYEVAVRKLLPEAEQMGALKFLRVMEVLDAFSDRYTTERLPSELHRVTVERIWQAYEMLVEGATQDNPWCYFDPNPDPWQDTVPEESDNPPPDTQKEPIREDGAIRISEHFLSLFIATFGRRHHLDYAQQIVDDLISFGFRPSPKIWNMLLTAYGRNGNLVAMRTTWNNFLELGGTVDVYMITTMINAFFETRNVTEAMDMYDSAMQYDDEDIKSSVAMHNAVLSGLLNNGRREAANSILEGMRESGPKPDATTYNTLLKYHARKGSTDKFTETFREMIAEGVKPDVYTLTTVVTTLLKFDQHDAVPQVLEVAKKIGVEANVATYTSMITAAVKLKGRMVYETAFELILHMETEGIKPNEVTFTSIMAGVTRDESLTVEESEDILARVEQMMTDRDIQPNRVTRNFLIKASLAREDGVEIAMDHWKRLRDGYVTSETYFALLEGLWRRNEFAYVREVLDWMRESGYKPHAALDRFVQKLSRELSLRQRA